MNSARSFVIARWLVAALVVCTGLLTVSGIAASYFDLGPEWNARLEMACAASFAGIAVFALATSQVAASMAQTLSRSPDHRLAFRMAVGCTLLTGAISVGGAHMGALVLGLNPLLVDAAGLALAFVKPCMSFVAEACADIERKATLDEDHRAQAAEFELRRLTIERTTANAAAAPAPAPPIAPAKAAREMSRAIRAAQPKQRRFAGERTHERPASTMPPLTADEIRRACTAIALRAAEQQAAGKPCEVISIRSVAREIGCDPGRIKRHPERKAVFSQPDFAHALAA